MTGFVPGVYQTVVPPASVATLQTGVPVFFGYGSSTPSTASPLIIWPVTMHWVMLSRTRALASSSSSSSSSSGATTVVFNQPYVLTQWSQFVTLAPLSPDPYLATAVKGFFDCGGTQCQVVLLDQSLAFNYALPPGPNAAYWISTLATIIPVLENVDLVCAPSVMWDPMESAPIDEFAVGLVYQIQSAILQQCESRGDLFAILDSIPLRLVDNDLNQFLDDWLGRLQFAIKETGAEDSRRSGAVYFPWVQLPGDPSYYPPSGHVAGVYSTVDSNNGPQAAPANQVLDGPVNVQFNVTDRDQSVMDPSINCLRVFPNSGITVWGARTLADPASSGTWIYISVRRLFITIGRWLILATQWAVFEPNDLSLWLRLNRQLSLYFENLFLNGMLKGASPGDSFYIKCDAENNPASNKNSGVLNVEIGLVPATPGELIVVQLTQSAAGATVAVSG